jgi:hypothetical protein
VPANEESQHAITVLLSLPHHPEFRTFIL